MSDEIDFDKDYLSIKEFADVVGMTVNTLRYYDKRGIFKPDKFGEEYKNQYRYYSPTQITTIKMIRVLTEIGVPLNEIKELASSRSPEKLIKLFSKQQGIVADELRFLQEVHLVISTFLKLLIDGISATETDITVTELPERKIILGDVNEFYGTAGFYKVFMRFCNAPHEPKLNLAYPVGGYFEHIDAFLREPSKPTRFFSLNPNGNDKQKAGLYLLGYTRGYYGKTNDLPKKMAEFAEKNELIFNGPVYNIYLFDEMSVINPEQYLLQISMSVKETRRVQSRRPVYH